MQNKPTLLERGWARIMALAAEYKLPLITGFVFALAANLYAFTNKFVNADELEYIFDKGATLSSGRWALALTSLIFPDVSMPWIYGVIASVLLSVAACVIIRTFEIKGRILQCVLAGLIVSFPVQALTFTYMFTSAPYALAVLLITLAVYVSLHGGRGRWGGVLLLTFALGIYQAYISLASGLFLVYIIKGTLDGKMSWQRLLRQGLGCIAVLLAAAALYFAVNKAVMLVTNTEYNSYASKAVRPNISFGLQAANAMFKAMINSQFLRFVPTEFSALVHKLLILLAVTELAVQGVLCNDRGKRVILAVLVLIFPIGINCLLLISPVPHPVEYFSFFSLYVLVAAATDRFSVPAAYVSDAVTVLLVLVLAGNLVFSNMIYLKQRLLYEQGFGFYSGVAARIKAQDGYDAGDAIVLVGASEEYSGVPEIDTDGSELPGVGDQIINVYSRANLIRYYLGFDAEIQQLNDAENEAPAMAAEIEDMPIYPYDGSVKCIGSFVVVKLG